MEASPRRVFLAMPGYGRQTASAGRALWRASRDMDQVRVEYKAGSLLANNFNSLWCSALNAMQEGDRVDYFAMLHDDLGLEDGWLDALIAELEACDLDVLGVVAPIKDTRGLTSVALHKPGDNWRPKCRLSMQEVHQLPETFTSSDVGHPLLINTGCWVCRFDMAWAPLVHFEINDRIVVDKKTGRYEAQVEPEDWYFSRLLHELHLRVGVTRKLPVFHRGELDFTTAKPWGSCAFDVEAVRASVLDKFFPEEIPGWLTHGEGCELARLARGLRVLEIGSYMGRSTICLAKTAEHVTAVDYFDGRATGRPTETYETFLANLERYDVAHKVEARHPDDELPREAYDLAFIDGAHDYESVLVDIDKCMPALKPDGLIVFHDYASGIDPGVTRAVNEFVEDGATVIAVHDSMAVVRPPVSVTMEKQYV